MVLITLSKDTFDVPLPRSANLDALIAFTQAQKIPQSAKTAKQWFHYVEREQGQHERLAMLN